MQSKLVFLIFSIILASVHGQTEYCYAQDDNPYLYFGTKSPYDIKSTKDISVPSGCSILYVYGIIRHGTRYPTESDNLKQDELTQLRDQIVKNHETDKRGKLCTQDIELLKNWKYSWVTSEYGKLTDQGKADVEGVADRIVKKLDEFAKNIEKDKLMLRTSSKDRCKDSAIKFANVLYKSSSDLDGNKIKVDDGMMRGSQENDNKKSDNQELEKFKKSDAMAAVITRVSERCGYQTKLSIDQVIMMYKQCVFEKAIKPADKAAFCTPFTKVDMQTMEYPDDLETYYEHGPGSSTKKDKSCPMIRDVLKVFSELENNANPSQIATFNFGHSSSVCSFIANLGMRKDDEALRSDNFEKYKESRKWRTSLMNPFASNVIMVVSKCSGELQVSTYNNERYERPQGFDSDLVPYKTVKEKLQAIVKECPAVESSAAGFLIVREHLVLLICIMFGFLHKFAI